MPDALRGGGRRERAVSSARSGRSSSGSTCKKIKGLMANPIIVDGRNIFHPEDVRKLGFEYYSVGRK